mmetsp:Transcript_23627/g.35142  ORF Transcript_23627/g.35142 Transcript_23627/m.35142 type:complete len:274 (-) Transcript_23627:93-914(-)
MDETFRNDEGDHEITPWFDSISTTVLIILTPTVVILLQVIVASKTNNTNKGVQVASTSKTSDEGKTNHHHDHNRRRIQHALTGSVFYALSFILPYSIACLLLSTATALFYVLHLFRSRSNKVQRYYIQHFGPLLREHELNVHTIPGAFWFLLGTTILVFSFSMDVVRTSLLCLSFGDPVASTAGMSFGGPKVHFRHGNKSLVGCCSCFVACVLISILCMGLRYGCGIWVLTGCVATVMEVSSGFLGVDDNILIPLGTGVSLSMYIASKGILDS